MTALGLLFVGAVLFVNGLNLLGRVDGRGAAPINAFVGTLLLAVAASLVIPVRDFSEADTRDLIVAAAGLLLFALTYLWVALNHWTGAPASGLGWYCLWAATVSAFLAIINFARYHDPRFGTLWILWTMLFVLFFLVLALEQEHLTRATGWIAIVEALITTTVPGALLLLGWWDSVPGSAAVAVGAMSLATFAALLTRCSRRASTSRSSATEASPVALPS